MTIASAHADTAATNDTRQVVTFNVSDEEYGVPILAVREIIRRVQTTSIPCAGPGIEGIINLRGTIIPVVRMAERLGVPSRTAEADDERIVVLDIGRSQVGFLVDRVRQVLRVHEERVAPPPRLGANNEAFLEGVAKLEDRLVLLLAPTKLTNEQIDEAAAFALEQHTEPAAAA